MIPSFSQRELHWGSVIGHASTAGSWLENIADGHVQAYAFGYDPDFYLTPTWLRHLERKAQPVTLGSSEVPYGSHPAGVAVFVRFRQLSADVQ
jgi:hypothetical protein